jgi:hypothetical protein
MPTPRTILLTCLFVVGVYCVWVGTHKSGSSSNPDADVTVESSNQPKPLPESDEPLKPAESLVLKVRPQDRFPLIKTVRQILKQPSPLEGTTSNQSILELVMSVGVEEVRPTDERNPKAGVVRMSVRYHRIRFSQDLPGHEIDYDSDRPPANIPLELQAYHGLKDNGFQFWLSADNQIVEAVGFDKFLERCLEGVARQHRDRVRSIVESTSGTEGVANFIDQSIGVLPADRVREGATWSEQKKYLQPVPMWIKNQYTLKSLNRDTAVIEILGSVEKITNYVSPSALAAPVKDFENPLQPARNQVAVEIRTGHTVGSYVIDRQTGLPRDSRVEQTLAMTVHLPGGQNFPQEKTTVTTIGYFTPDRSGAIIIGDSAAEPGRVQHAEAVERR